MALKQSVATRIEIPAITKVAAGQTWDDQVAEPVASGAENAVRQATSVDDPVADVPKLPVSTVDSEQMIELEQEEPHRRNPIFSLSLPSTNQPVLARYFECAGLDRKKFGRYWTHLTHPSPFRRPIGKCMYSNFKRNLPIMEGCGDYDVWQDLPWFEEPLAEKPDQIGLCFDPVIHPGALMKLYQAHPNATVINMIKDPQMWYKQLPFDIHERWSKWCKPPHDIPYPTQNTEAAYVEFYEKYHEFLRQFVATQAISWTMVEIDLTLPSEAIATTLAFKLGIHSQCWIEATQGNIPLYNATMPPGVQALTEQLPRNNDITYPLLVVTLEKSGTSTAHSYFECALGSRVPVHQFTFRNGTYTEVGKCWEANDRTGRPSLENCGHKRVFSDINFFHPTLNHCYFPVLEGGFDKFAKSYPYATVLMQIRTATSWYTSVKRWNRLDQRWSSSPGCRQKGVTPEPMATQADWEGYYENYTRMVRQTVSQYPTLNYVEVPLSEDMGPVLDSVFGFSQETQCFGHENRNPSS